MEAPSRRVQLPSTAKLLQQAIAVRDAVDGIVARYDGDPEALLEQLGKADGVEKAIARWQAAVEDKRRAANIITIARLKLMAAIGRALPRAAPGRGKKNPNPPLGISAPCIARYRKVADVLGKLSDYEQLLDGDEDTEASATSFLSWAHVKPHPKMGKKAKTHGTKGATSWSFAVADCRALPLKDNSVDLVFCSPPYEGQRSYNDVAFDLTGDSWVAWAVACFVECLRVSKGLVAWVVEGTTEDYRYSCTPFLLMCELHRLGYAVRKPCVYHRNGIPGTGGPDWLRNDWEPVICATKDGKIAGANNTAMGKPPVVTGDRKATNRNKDGSRKSATYKDPDVTNPGNIIHGKVGAGQLGWKDAHLNEAPFPQWLANFFVQTFCPEGGTVLDPFSGSGTTVAAAVAAGRNGIGYDVREDQVWLGETRLLGLTVAERKDGQQLLV